MNNPYIGAVYRPPSEASSLIIQSTIGCSQNHCTFCTMYKEKNFALKPVAQVIDQIDECMKHYGGYYKRIFLADKNGVRTQGRTPNFTIIKCTDEIHKNIWRCEIEEKKQLKT